MWNLVERLESHRLGSYRTGDLVDGDFQLSFTRTFLAKSAWVVAQNIKLVEMDHDVAMHYVPTDLACNGCMGH